MAEPALKIVQNIPNDLDLTAAEKQALLVRSLVEIEGLVDQKNTIVSQIRTARKKLVANGFAPKVIDFALRLRKDEDDTMIEQRRAEIEVARFLNHPIGTQPELPLDMVDRMPEVDRAFSQGEIAGAEGKSCIAPFAAGSPMEQSWIRGWGKGQDTIASAFQKLEAKEAVEESDDEEGED